MTTKDEKHGVELGRQDMDKRCSKAGHTMAWKLAPNANRKGWAYYFLGDCTDCGATVSTGSAWSSCSGVRDARHTHCSGPGTSILTAIEQARLHDLTAAAIRRFGRDIAAQNRRTRKDT